MPPQKSHDTITPAVEAVDRRRLLQLGGAAGAGALAGLAMGPATASADGTFAEYAMAGTFTRGQAIRPSVDETALTLQAGAGGQTPILAVEDAGGTPVFSVTKGNHGRLNMPDTGAGHGSLVLDASLPVFNGTADPILYVGYNHAGVPIKAGEPSIAIAYEGDYNDGSKRTMELYAEAYAENSAAATRPWFWQFRRNATTNESFMTWSQIMGNPLRIVDTAETLLAQFGTDRVQFNTKGVFRQRSGDTSDLLQVMNDAGSVNLRANAAGQLVVNRLGIRRSPNANFEVFCVSAGELAYSSRTDNDPQARHYVTAAGDHRWGSGTAGVDVSLYRAAARQLKTDQQFVAADGVATKEINSSGRSSAQIDALFGSTPPNGTIVSDPGNRLLLVRQNGKWSRTQQLQTIN